MKKSALQSLLAFGVFAATFVSPALAATATLDAMQTWLADNASLRHKNAAVYFPRTFAPDPVNGNRLRSIAASGTIAGLFARTDATRGVWKAPAGTDARLQNIQGLAYTLSDPENGALNPQLAPMEFVQSDYFPAIRQFAGLPVSQRRGHKLPAYPRLEPREFDLVLLDPPAWAKSAFGTVDLLRDYQSLLKPALLTTADNGVLICCNNLAKVSMDDWREQVLRCAEKAGRPVREWQALPPAADFPSMDQQPPLKTLILQL